MIWYRRRAPEEPLPPCLEVVARHRNLLEEALGAGLRQRNLEAGCRQRNLEVVHAPLLQRETVIPKDIRMAVLMILERV